jgi:hypothetical protein
MWWASADGSGRPDEPVAETQPILLPIHDRLKCEVDVGLPILKQ